MKIQFIRNMEKYIKSRINRLFINQTDFTIISNNCWGTFIYKKYGLPYQSPFINLMLFAPDYIDFLENFSLDSLKNLEFIPHEESKYKDEMQRLGIYGLNYPLGLLDGKYELNFLHYTSKEEAKEKWFNRLKRINPEKLIFKFSDGDLFEDEMAHRFDKLPFKHKLLFTAKPYKDVKSNIWIEKFKNGPRVHDEWKHFHKHYNINKLINAL